MQPSELFAVIESQPDIDHETWKFQRIADALNETTVETKTGERVNSVTLLNRLEPAEVGLFRMALETLASNKSTPELAVQAAFAATVRDALTASGIEISDPRAVAFVDTVVRDELTKLQAGPVADKIIGIGVQVERLLAEDVTAAECEAAIRWDEDRRWFADRYNAAAEVLAAGGTRAEIVAALTAE